LLLADRKWAEVVSLLADIAELCRFYAKHGNVGLAARFLREVAAPLQEKFEQGAFEEADLVSQVALVDSALTPAVTTCLGFLDWLEAIDRPPIQERLSDVRWSNAASPYKRGFPIYLLDRVEWLQARLLNEIAADGEQVSPPWYLAQMVAQAEAEAIASATAEVGKLLHEYFDAWDGCGRADANDWVMACVRSRRIEALKKTLRRAKLLGCAWDSDSQLRKQEDLWWPTLVPQEWVAQVAESVTGTVAAAGELLVRLVALERPPGLPDYAGQFHQEVAEAVLQGLFDNRPMPVSRLFESFFAASVLYFERDKPKGPYAPGQTEPAFLRAAASLENLLELSGVSYIMSQLHCNPALWDPVKTMWDRVIEGREGEQFLQVVAATVGVTSNPLYGAGGVVLRTGWHLRMFEVLQALPRHYVVRGGIPIAVARVEHPSPLIRFLARNELPIGIDGKAIFLQLYLMKQPVASKLQWPRALVDLERELQREESRGEGQTGDDK
jgi:hypothetical protein